MSALADRHLEPATVGRILAAIGHHHRLAGLVAPHKAEGGTVIADVLAGIRRSHATPPARKAAADSYVVHAVLRAITGDTLADLRDRALVAFGMASALRRSELAPTGEGSSRSPSLNAWLARASISDGPAFRSLVTAGAGLRSPTIRWRWSSSEVCGRRATTRRPLRRTRCGRGS